jgi:hypothetical protein
VTSYLEAFAISSDKLTEKWTDCLLREGGKENMYVLWAVRELQRKGYDEYKKLRFLEVFNDLLKEELEGTMKIISEEMKRFRIKVVSLMDIDEEEIAEALKAKYERIINIESQDQIVELPCRL